MSEFNCYINPIGSKYSKMSNGELHEVLNTFKSVNAHDRLRFREEIVKRGFVSWDEINTKYEIVRTNVEEPHKEHPDKELIIMFSIIVLILLIKGFSG